ncbi:dol-P-Glc:Glc(2)Man(9)GlcNAc(2)-PP-Dol alpha-1,2-glucosyltransferase [Impatiens glandulifera]|uniref:dol-P-Glc:Glc(2)Man(9)GlcNAc(2)-PP-Dol alpha-1,2-glucosyltransferase n=1 Tax=Impatiens glandulifera TaxID=253017 RepID=UPI001FB07AEE|nr:dol-P-Glc:Glc(2)Man(9)GlcNAc(2)-PP-Dol alpha-1,2-glucosyltransferase [Impatiens glandulifera]
MGRIAVALIVSSWVIPISILVNHIVPDPYMDEIFHVPQAQQYCKGYFTSWDPMITTPPGLYYVSLAYVGSLFPGMFCVKVVSSFYEACSSSILRSTNGVLAVICSILVYEVITQLRPTLDERKATAFAVVMALYPLHWFFTFLYYTDVASVTAVLATYLACLKRKYACSALLGLFAVLLRQTNIIWILFVACIGIINCTLVHEETDGKKIDSIDVSAERDGQETLSVRERSILRKRRLGTSENSVNHYSQMTNSPSLVYSSGIIDEVNCLLLRMWHLKWKLLFSFSPFLLVLVAFVAFVLWNGSIVLGAKDAHAVSAHVAQILYFGLVSALFIAPLHFTPNHIAFYVRSFWSNKFRSIIQWFMALSVGFLSVHFFSIAHPYLLADNRHYPFYIWRKIINAHWAMKYLLVPLYVYSWFSILRNLEKSRKKIWVLVYFVCCVATLVPAPLIEFRYYTIPFFFLVLHCEDIFDYRSLVLMGMAYVTINVFTMVMFLFRPFKWDHEPGLQRFIW